MAEPMMAANVNNTNCVGTTTYEHRMSAAIPVVAHPDSYLAVKRHERSVQVLDLPDPCPSKYQYERVGDRFAEDVQPLQANQCADPFCRQYSKTT